MRMNRSINRRLFESTVRRRSKNTTGTTTPRSTTWALDCLKLQESLEKMVGALCPKWFGPDLREEVSQETLLRLVQLGDLPGNEPREFCSSFLYKTISNVRLEMVRRIGKQRIRESILASDEESYLEILCPHANPERVVRSGEIGHCIDECLRRLQPDRHRAVTLHLLGLKVPEIAHQLGWKKKSAENRVFRGLDQLRTCLKQRGEGIET